MAVFESLFVVAAVLVGLVTALTELIKKTVPNLSKNLVPIIAFVLGVVLGLLSYPFTELPIDQRAWAGAIAGLAATGLYELAFNPRPGKADK